MCQKNKARKSELCKVYYSKSNRKGKKKLLTFGKVSSVYTESRQVSHENKMRLGFLDTINWD